MENLFLRMFQRVQKIDTPGFTPGLFLTSSTTIAWQYDVMPNFLNQIWLPIHFVLPKQTDQSFSGLSRIKFYCYDYVVDLLWITNSPLNQGLMP